MNRIKRSQAKQFIRWASLNQASVSSGPISTKYDSVGDSQNLGHVKSLPNLKTVDEVQLEAIGSPPSALTIGAPPSLPIYIRRNTLLTLQAKLENIKLTPKLIDPFRRLLYGNFTSRFQEVMGSTPFTMMVSSSTPFIFPWLYRRTTPKSFASIPIDGTKDWAILKRDALQVYAGPSLNISMRKLPSKISRKLSKSLNLTSREPTGLFRWHKSGYTFVNGRGALGLVGNGLLYSATLAEREEIAVNRQNLVGVSVNGPHDLQNCVIQYSNPVAYQNIQLVAPSRPVSIKSFRDLKMEAYFYYWKCYQLVQQMRKSSAKGMGGNQDFVRIIGPRSILLQSGAPQESLEKAFELPKLALPYTLETSAKTDVEKTPSDYLNVVTIKPGEKTTIQSVPDYKESLPKTKI